MKDYLSSRTYLRSRFTGARLDAALTALEYANDVAIAIGGDLGAAPVWSDTELDEMGLD